MAQPVMHEHRQPINGGDGKAEATTIRNGQEVTLPGQSGRDGDNVPSPGHPTPTNGIWRDVDWLYYRDGKWRPVEPAFKQMVDGTAIGLVYMCSECNEQERKMIYETANSTSGRQVLQALRSTDAPEAIWLQVGRQAGFHAASILLAVLLQQERQLGEIKHSETQGIDETRKKILRAMRQNRETACTPQRLELPEQYKRQLADLMPKLPQTGTFELLRTINGFPLADKSPARVGRLRGYGNCIVAPQAKIFIETAIECLQ